MSTTETSSQESGGTTQSAGQGAEYWQGEARKAFEARQRAKAEADDLRAKLDALKGIDAEEYKSLKEQKEHAEQERAKKAGEFDKLQQQLIAKHQAELAERDKKLTETDKRYRDMVIGRAFADSVDLFGPNGKTIYLPRIAERVFGQYVRLQDDGALVVTDQNGDVILDPKTARPKAFAAAMAELIESMPDKDYHLRGSATTGSGSSGGATTTQKPGDIDALIERVRRNPGDKDAADKLRAIQRAKGGNITFGPS